MELGFVAKVVELSYSEIRQMFPSFKKDLSEIGENAEVGRGMSWSQEISSRKESVGIDNWLLNEAADESDEANTVLPEWGNVISSRSIASIHKSLTGGVIASHSASLFTKVEAGSISVQFVVL